MTHSQRKMENYFGWHVNYALLSKIVVVLGHNAFYLWDIQKAQVITKCQTETELKCLSNDKGMPLVQAM